jgi:trk system potassium uptake protein
MQFDVVKEGISVTMCLYFLTSLEKGRCTSMKIAIVGAGKLGCKVAEALLGGDHSVTMIDKDEEALQSLSSQMDVMTIAANAKEVSVLKELHIASYDFLLTATDRDEKNLVIGSFAKKLGCPRVIARIRDPEHMNQSDFIKETMSIDHLINPDLNLTMQIFRYLAEKYTLQNGIYSIGKVALLEFAAAKMPKIIGLTPAQVREAMPEMMIVAISRYGKVIVPKGHLIIDREDILYAIGEREAMMALNKKVRVRGRWTNLQKVMIIGGGKTGLYLAQHLSDFGASVKLIEKEKARCHYLSEHLDGVMILHGDGTDIGLLEEENLNEMDAFVTATGYDEDNLILALMAKSHGVEDVIAKVSRKIYSDMISSLGVDMVLNPLDIAVSHILRIIQGNKRVLSSELIQGQAEIMEIVAADHMKLTERPLKEIQFPNGVVVAAIHRGTELIIPNPETIIEKNDRVTILCLLSELTELEKLLRTTGRGDFIR